MTQLTTYRQKTDKLKLKQEHADMQVQKLYKSLESNQQKLEHIEEARTIAQSVAQSIQQRAHNKIASVVTRCLAAVFDDPYEFHIRFDQKRGKTEASLVLVRDGQEYDDPKNEVGGGVVDIVSLSLRLACVMLSKPLRQRLLVLDEPFRNVRGKINRQRLRGMILGLANEMDFQFILNVDADSYPEFVLGTVVEMPQ